MLALCAVSRVGGAGPSSLFPVSAGGVAVSAGGVAGAVAAAVVVAVAVTGIVYTRK